MKKALNCTTIRHAHQTLPCKHQEWCIFKQCCLELASGWAIFNHAEQAPMLTYLVIWKPYFTVAQMWLSGKD